jgi:hypothetical protein
MARFCGIIFREITNYKHLTYQNYPGSLLRIEDLMVKIIILHPGDWLYFMTS